MSAADDVFELAQKAQQLGDYENDVDTATMIQIDSPTDRESMHKSTRALTDSGKMGGGSTAPKRQIEPDGCAERLAASQTRDIYWHIWEDDKDKVKEWLNKGQVMMKDSHGFAAVHYAAKFNRPEIMRMLVEEGCADVKAKTVSEGYNPLHLAACYLRHAYKPSKSAKPPETTDQPDTAEQDEIQRMQSDTLELPWSKKRRHSSNPPIPFERQTSCKEIFQFLVEDCEEIDVNAKDQYGFTPLHIACQSGNKEAVESLLGREDIDLSAKDGNGDTPLHEACFHGHVEIVEILLNKMENKKESDEAKVNGVLIKNDASLTPFHIACREDHCKIINLLLHRYRSELRNVSDNDGATPLHYACRNDSVKTIELFMDESSESNFYGFLTPKTSDGVTPMHVAAQYGCVKVMKLFLDKPLHSRITGKTKAVDVRDTYDQTPLHYAAEYGKLEMMKLLIERGANKEAEDAHSYTPLLTAAESGQVEGFRHLLDEGALLVNMSEGASTAVQNKDRKTALFLAAEYNHPKIIELILERSGRGRKLYTTTDTSLNTPLHIAAQNDHLESIRMLWHHRSKLDLKLQAKNAMLKTAMHLAAENGHNHILIELQHYWQESGHELTNTGRLLKSTDDDGNTPLHVACKHGFVDVAKTLIKMPGADIGARNKVLWTPLDCAAANGHARVIKELATAKAELDPKDKLKTTPLHLAAKEGHVTAVETLIKHGANVGLKDQRGFNALDWAIEKGHKDVAEAIITSSKWKLALRNCTDTQDGGETTPFRKLIQRMPDIAQLVLKKCTTTNAKEGTISQDSKEYSVMFSYEFIEDSQDAKEWKANKMEESDEEKPVERKCELIPFLPEFCCCKKRGLKHPLKIMVESKRAELLKHPLIYRLIDHKWRFELVAAFFYFSLVCYLLFAILLTALALKLPNPLSPTCDVTLHQNDPVNVSQYPSPAVRNYLINRNITIDADGIANISRQHLCNDVNVGSNHESLAVTAKELFCGLSCPVQSRFLVAASWFIVVFCVIRSLRQLWMIIRFLHQFSYCHIASYVDDIDLATLVKFPLIVCTLTFVGAIINSKCRCLLEWQWQVGIAAVFLAWADLVLYMRKLRFLDTGLYVLMFQSIFKTFLRVMILTILLVVMFALAFHLTFNHFHSFFERSPFTNMLDSTWKTMTMTVGEMGYEDIFHLSSGGTDNNIPPLLFPEISYILWVIFLILMPILFTNLLVGLAVDDIKGIQEAATLTRLAMRVELILALDRTLFRLMQKLMFKLPKFPGHRNCRRLHDQRELTVHPNRLSIYSFVPKFLAGENYSSAEHLSLELNPTKTPTDQQAQNLMWEISKIQETLLLMNEELKGLREVKERVLKLSEEKIKEQAHDSSTQT